MTRITLERIRSFIASEAALVISAVVAALSMLLFAPTPGHLTTYASYIDWRTIGLLFCLMTVVAGLTRSGLVARVRRALMGRSGNARSLAFTLINVVFASSMLITNDVALITFVPLTLAMLLHASPRAQICTVVAETVAANLGSMATPIGNPQNIYLVSAFHLDLGAFFATMGPLTIVSYLLCIALSLTVPRERIDAAGTSDNEPLKPTLIALYMTLFALCLACVARIIPWQPCAGAVLVACLLFDRGVFKAVDYSLLATFICFFIFVGNLQQVDAVAQTLSGLMDGREIIVAALASQVISNVPAAIMLSGFTANAQALLLGTNIGGLGTPVASLASLISLRIYARIPGAQTGRYLAVFLVANVTLLAILLTAVCIAI